MASALQWIITEEKFGKIAGFMPTAIMKQELFRLRLQPEGKHYIICILSEIKIPFDYVSSSNA